VKLVRLQPPFLKVGLGAICAECGLARGAVIGCGHFILVVGAIVACRPRLTCLAIAANHRGNSSCLEIASLFVRTAKLLQKQVPFVRFFRESGN
jgi:hypothetical protein